MVKISKRVYFGDIKVHFLDTLARPVDLTDMTFFELSPGPEWKSTWILIKSWPMSKKAVLDIGKATQ